MSVVCAVPAQEAGSMWRTMCESAETADATASNQRERRAPVRSICESPVAAGVGDAPSLFVFIRPALANARQLKVQGSAKVRDTFWGSLFEDGDEVNRASYPRL